MTSEPRLGIGEPLKSRPCRPALDLPPLRRRNQRNVGREPSTVQILDNKQGGTTFPSFDYGSNLTLQLVLPSDAADADLVLPQPNRFRAPCPLGSSPDPTDEFATCVPCAPGSFNDGASAACERCDLQVRRGQERSAAGACMRCPCFRVSACVRA